MNYKYIYYVFWYENQLCGTLNAISKINLFIYFMSAANCDFLSEIVFSCLN